MTLDSDTVAQPPPGVTQVAYDMFDPAEVAARVVGEGAAHRLVGGLRGLFGWGRRSAATLTLDTAEYLREETRDLARRVDAEEWMDAVDTLREDTDRLEARLRRIERVRAGGAA